jgi:pullulanase/glycogen debranching enzyme
MAFDANPELRDFTCKIIHIRRSNPALTSGATREILADREVFAYLREAGGSKILVVVNNSSHQQERSLEISENGAWINLLDGNEFESAERELKVRLQARSALILQLSQNARAGDIGIA